MADEVKALQGIKIVDLSLSIPAQISTSMLADMGADVVAVGRAGEAGPARIPIGRNKRSCLVNLKDERGRAIVWRLLEDADVFVEGYRPGVIARLGFPYEAVHARLPRIIYCSVSGYGQQGPKAMLAGHDVAYAASGGLLRTEDDGTPLMPHASWVDRQATMHLLATILLGLLARERTGRGQFADLAYVDAGLALPAAVFAPLLGEGIALEPQALAGFTGASCGSVSGPSVVDGRYPLYGIYRARDGKYLALGTGGGEAAFAERICRFIGRPEWASVQHPSGTLVEEMRTFLQAKFLERDRDDWVQDLAGIDVPVAPVNTGFDVLEDPHLQQRGCFVSAEEPEGTVWQLASPFRLSESPARTWRALTWEGQDTLAILDEMGYSPEERDRLLADGVVQARAGR